MKQIIVLILLVAIAGCSKKVIKSNEFGDTEYYVEEIKPLVKEVKKVEPVKEIKLPVNYNEIVYFNLDSDVLTAVTMEILDDLALRLEAYPNCRIVIIGNCCPLGTDGYNYRLGIKRGDTVERYLSLQLPKFSDGQIMISSNGEGEAIEGPLNTYYKFRNCKITVTE